MRFLLPSSPMRARNPEVGGRRTHAVLSLPDFSPLTSAMSVLPNPALRVKSVPWCHDVHRRAASGSVSRPGNSPCETQLAEQSGTRGAEPSSPVHSALRSDQARRGRGARVERRRQCRRHVPLRFQPHACITVAPDPARGAMHLSASRRPHLLDQLGQNHEVAQHVLVRAPRRARRGRRVLRLAEHGPQLPCLAFAAERLNTPDDRLARAGT